MSTKIARIARPIAWRHDFIRTHNYRCHYCNRPGGLEMGPDARPWHIDHMTALAVGGADIVENLMLACRRCNVAKGAQAYTRFQRFAKVAFWADSVESASDEEMDKLLDAYLDTHDGDWHLYVAPDQTEESHHVLSRERGKVSDEADTLVAELPQHPGRTCKGRAAAIFLVHAHRLVPQLIAEVRTLRAELAEARGELDDDTALETSVV